MLWTGFVRSAERFAERPALWVAGRTLTYAALFAAARRLAATLRRHGAAGETLTAVLAQRSEATFAGILAALLAGRGYVPLNPSFPAERNGAMFERSGARSVVVDAAGLEGLDALLEGSAEPVTVLAPETDDLAALRQKWPVHRFFGPSDFEDADAWRAPAADPDAVAYLLFTSGSTGAPKGVSVAHRNVAAFLDAVIEPMAVTEHDRFSQMFETTFDLSVFDMFVCWERGALLCCPSQKTLISPGRFIVDQGLTVWFSTPSTAIFMNQLGMLKAGRYPSLRLSLFCGEPLPVASAVAWRKAAPGARLENLYGPTELTIACTRHVWDDEISPDQSELGIVPIGEAFEAMNILVADEALGEVGPGEVGELLMSGPQVSLGYLDDAARTAAAFVVPPGRDEVFYRTGDRVRRPKGAAPMTHLGRLDGQIKVLGHRVELGEIEAAIRTVSGLDGVVAIGWPATASGFGGIEAFVEGEGQGDRRAAVASLLPDYMVPRRIHAMARLPRNASGKFDRGALKALLEGGL